MIISANLSRNGETDTSNHVRTCTVVPTIELPKQLAVAATYIVCTTCLTDDDESTLPQVTTEHEDVCMVGGYTICACLCATCVTEMKQEATTHSEE